MIDQYWAVGGTTVDRFKYGYDRHGSRLYKENASPGGAAYSDLYRARLTGTYDDLDQLSEFLRGTLTAGKDDVTEATPTRRQKWTSLDLLGNWTTFDEWVSSTQTTQNRTHNRQNQLTQLNSTTLTYDLNGNLTQDEAGRTLAYDAWNRLVSVGTVSYAYDALYRRLTETFTSPALTKSLYYSASWQVLEEHHDGALKAQYVWSPVYVDALVLRDRDADPAGGIVLEERLYAVQDANWNVTALVSTAGAVQERYTYDPYGLPTARDPGTWAERSVSYAWNYLHQGGRYEITTTLYHFRMREYSATLGRWVQVDPIGFAAGDGNLYGYVANTPVTDVDPFGLQRGGRPGGPPRPPGPPGTPTNSIGRLGRDIGNWLWGTQPPPPPRPQPPRPQPPRPQPPRPEPSWIRPPGWRLPRDGTWRGTPGDSDFVPSNPVALGLRPGDTIPFRRGFPDFSRCSKGNFIVPGLNGNPTNDMPLIWQHVAQQQNLPNQTAAQNWLTQQGLTPHHAGGNAVQLIPRTLHGGIRHMGGAWELRNQ